MKELGEEVEENKSIYIEQIKLNQDEDPTAHKNI